MPTPKTAPKSAAKSASTTPFKTPLYLARALEAAGHGRLAFADPDAARGLDAFTKVALRNALRNAAAVMEVCGGKTVTAKHFQVLADVQRHPVRMGAAARARRTPSPQRGGMYGATVLPSEYFGKASGRYGMDVAAQAGGSSSDCLVRSALPFRGFEPTVQAGGAGPMATFDLPKAFVDAEIKAFLASERRGAPFKVAKDAKVVLGAVAAHNLARALADVQKAARGATALTAGAVRRVMSSRAYRRYAVEV